jgi:hypothetical protein
LGFTASEGTTALQALYYQLALPEGQEKLKALRDQFCQSEKHGFVALKDAVTEEQKAIVKAAKNKDKKLDDSCNYVTMISSMNSLVENVHFVQQIQKAAELYMPDLGEKLGVDEKDKGLYANLMRATTESVGRQLAEKGVAYMIQDSVTQATQITKDVLDSTLANFDQKLAIKYDTNPEHKTRTKEDEEDKFVDAPETHDSEEDDEFVDAPETHEPESARRIPAVDPYLALKAQEAKKSQDNPLHPHPKKEEKESEIPSPKKLEQ